MTSAWTDDDILHPVTKGQQWSDADIAEPDSRWSRIGTGAADPVYGLAQIADKAINPIRQMISPGATSMDDVVKEREAAYRKPEGFDWARMGGNVVSPLNLATIPLQATGRGTSAIVGAGSAMMEPSQETGMEFVKDKAKQAALGGTLGALLPGLPKTKAAQELMDRGIQPTVGQSVGGWANKLEQGAESLPIVGSSVTNARRRGLDEFQEKVLQRATGSNAKTIDEANAAVSNMYEAVAPRLPQHQLDPSFGVAFQKALSNPELTPSNSELLTNIVQNRFANYDQLAGSQLKKLDEDLGSLIRKYSKSTDVSHHAVADGLRDIQTQMRDHWETLLPPELQNKLRQANTAFREMIPVNKASSARADEQIFPRALEKAMARQANRDVSRMPSDPLVDSAKAVLPNNLPDSGTATRLFTADMPTLGLATLMKIPAMLGGTRTGQKLLTGNTAQQSDPRYAAFLAAMLRQRQEQEQGQ